MQASERTKRDARIMRDVRAGVSSRQMRTRYQLTMVRINQIIAREQTKRAKRKAKA